MCQVGAVPVQVIVLNGGSSSGATSVGRAQRTHLPEPHLLIDAMPTPRPDRHDAPISVDADGTVRPGPTFRLRRLQRFSAWDVSAGSLTTGELTP